MAVTPYSHRNITINHNFALLNSGAGMGGFSVAQPPTYTITDNTGIPASTGARQYAFGVPTEVMLSGTSTGFVEWEGKYTTVSSQIAGTAPTNTLSSVIPQAAWNTTVSINGTPELNGIEYKFSLMRKAEPVFGINGQQSTFAIPRG